MMRYFLKTLTFLIISMFATALPAQLPEECKLDIGVNLGGLADYGTELPFVDLMKNARTWYTKDVGNPNAAFDSGHASALSYRADGYPTHAPQVIGDSPFPQKIVTIWGLTDGWPIGEYTLLWEGSGALSLFGTYTNLTQTDSHRMVFDIVNPPDGVVEITIAESAIEDPIRNIRLLMPGAEATYEEQPFNPVFLERMLTFKTVRFMDWGQTNNWGQSNGQSWNDPHLFDWEERSQMDHYTWAYEKGIPYEMMVKLMNDYELDGWLCVPHRASDEYLAELAAFFRDELDPERHLYVEYSNEIWNWIFGQTQWLNEYGCLQTGTNWPEGLVPYVQNCLDHFTTAFAGQMDRITRVVGTQASWLDVSQRIANNLTTGSFDAISPTFYFGLREDDDAALDQLGAAATVADIAHYARAAMPENFGYLQDQKNELADPLGVPLLFYEGGQHLTPHPFGVEPTYGDALVAVQRDTAMYNLYNEWFDLIRSLQTGDEPLQLMHFSFVSGRSAQYGSWGMLETMDQDTSLVPAPKYRSILENRASDDCQAVSTTAEPVPNGQLLNIWPNPTAVSLNFTLGKSIAGGRLELLQADGRLLRQWLLTNTLVDDVYQLNISDLPAGMYWLRLVNTDGVVESSRLIKQ